MRGHALRCRSITIKYSALAMRHRACQSVPPCTGVCQVRFGATDYYGDGRADQSQARASTSVRPAWTAGPAGWLTLLSTHQLIVLLTQLPGSGNDDQVDARDDVCPLIRNEILQREWSTD